MKFLNAAYTNNGWLSPEVLEENLTIIAHANVIPIGVLNYKYNVIDTNAQANGKIQTVNGQLKDKYVSGVWQNLPG